MSLEELLRNQTIRKIKPDKKLAQNTLKRAKRDVITAKTLISTNNLDWALAVSYNAMLTAGRSLMFAKGYRPSSTEGHLAVVKFLNIELKPEIGQKLVMLMDGMRKKRHRIVYDEMDIVSQAEAEQSVKWAEEFIDVIVEYIQ